MTVAVLGLCIGVLVASLPGSKAVDPFPIVPNITSTWSWRHDGTNENGLLTLYADGTSQWKDEKERGNWKLIQGGHVLEAFFGKVHHKMSYLKTKKYALLVEPVRTPPSTMKLISAVNGGFANFSAWTNCDAPCGGGTQDRSRTCSNPPRANGGADCVGEWFETRECNRQRCPVDGGFSDYGDWSECSVKCGGGVMTRTRSCTNPRPAYGGAGCERLGESTETRTCNLGACQVDGGYSDFGKWTNCTSRCGGRGTQKRFRTCTNPAPAHGGANCAQLGDKMEIRDCTSDDCVTIKPLEPTELKCKLGKSKKGCNPTYVVKKEKKKKINRDAVKICKVVDGVVTEVCQQPHLSAYNKYVLRSGKVVQAEFGGVYVAVYSEEGTDYVSDPVTVVVS